MKRTWLGSAAVIAAMLVGMALPVSATNINDYVFPDTGMSYLEAIRNPDGSYPRMGAPSPDIPYDFPPREECIVVTGKSATLEEDEVIAFAPDSPYTPHIDFTNETQVRAVAVFMLSAALPGHDIPDDLTFTITFPDHMK